MAQRYSLCFISTLLITLCCFSSPGLQAQIRTDGTTGPAKTLSGPDYRMGADLGKQVGGNLFHSFADFNIRTGESATFTGPASVENIISRVTGGTTSQVNGLLRSEISGANLFLLNPAGLIFGPEASLDISGSFHISTADYLRLGTEGRFDAVFPENDLLTSSHPGAFGFLEDSPRDIQISGSIEVLQNRDISLTGGAVEISDSLISAPGGHIRIFGAASPGESPISWSPDTNFSGFEKLADISLSDNCTVNTSAPRAGEIYIRGENFFLTGAKTSLSAVTGESDGGGIDIHARKNISAARGAAIFTATLAEGKGGDISVSSKSLFLDRGQIFSESGTMIPDGGGVRLIGGNGDGGDIRICFGSGDIRGGLISTNTLDTGKAGDITITGQSLKIREQSKIVADNGNIYPGEGGLITDGSLIGGKGDSGNITLNLDNLETDSSAISSNTLGNGAGGTISITAEDSLDIAGSGQSDPETPEDSYYGLGTQTLGNGRGGHIRISAGELNLSKDAMINGQTYGSGQGGDIDLNVRRLNLSEGGTVTASTRGAGNAGEILINAGESVSVSGAGQRLDKSRIYTATHSGGSGGKLTIETPHLTVSENGVIYSKTLGDDTWDGNTLPDGTGGDIVLNADRLDLSRGAVVTAGSESDGDAGNIAIKVTDTFSADNASVITSTEQSDGGDIRLNAGNRIHLSDSAVTTSVSGGQGNGGNISIDPRFVILNNSSIKARAYGGNGGNIHIAADQFIRSSDSIVDASSELGIDGETKIESPDTDIGGGMTVLPGNYTDPSRWLRTACADRSGEDISRLTQKQRDAVPTSPDDWLASPPQPFEPAPDQSPLLSDDSLLPRGAELYHKGDFGGAVRLWEQALPMLTSDHALYLRTLIYLSHAYQALGYHRNALTAFSHVLPVFEKSDDPSLTALFFSTLGDIHLSLGNRKAAREYLETALAQARRADDPYILSSVLNNMGNFFAAERDEQDAMTAYRESLEQTEHSDSHFHLKSKTALNSARLAFEMGNYGEQDIIHLLEDALGQILRQPDSHDKAWNRISLALLARKVRKALKSELSSHAEKRLRSLVSESLEEARKSAKPPHPGHAGLLNPATGSDLPIRAERGGSNEDHGRIASYACGYLGQFLEEENRVTEALDMTREAVFFAQQQYCPEILYLWQRQLGKLFASRGDMNLAILSYQDAAETLNPIRTEFFRGYRDRRSVFYEKIKPVYMELAELLLETAGDESPGKDRLIRARDTMEVLKAAELEDFFQDECLTASQEKLQKAAEFVPPHTAVIYPISLPDRLEILVSLPEGMKQITVPETSGDLRKRARIFHERLTEEYSDRYKTTAVKLYEILIQPLENDLISQDIKTLVVSPDDVLRLVPFSALMNPADNSFLIEKYAVGTVPGITLTDYEPPGTAADNILLCGLSEGNPPLPRVPEELENIREIMGSGKVLLNQDFTVSGLSDEFRNRTYPVIHMATHGEFSGVPEETFLAAYNEGTITMNDLEKLILTGTLRGIHTELLTFSACQTAAGDERAGLGLAGLTVMAGARSAIATLWSVTDEAASLTITEFYRQFCNGVSKAESLQKAQKKCIGSADYHHPAYWAPFLLIGNWM
ncbi:CHAT domain-containing protein [Desulfococcaceae bacterium HSG8]|nr:CHAT domain-containing protein [Desulfococcaceae bacterium HSG8]